MSQIGQCEANQNSGGPEDQTRATFNQIQHFRYEKEIQGHEMYLFNCFVSLYSYVLSVLNSHSY